MEEYSVSCWCDYNSVSFSKWGTVAMQPFTTKQLKP